MEMSTFCLVAITSASHAEDRQFDPGQVHFQSVIGRMVDTSTEAHAKEFVYCGDKEMKSYVEHDSRTPNGEDRPAS